jgi:hypothetical protein
MRNPSRSRVAVAVVAAAALCLLGQVATVSPVRADDTPLSAGAPLPAGARSATLLMSEDFEGTFPSGLWTAFDNDGATNGEYFWGADDFKPHAGSRSAWPARNGANGLDPESDNYPNSLYTKMVYGPFDLSGYAAASFDFYYWNLSETGLDAFFWGASGDGTSFGGTAVSGDSGGWVYQSLDLSSYLGDSSVWIAFIFVSSPANADVGPFVDDIGLWGEALPPPGAFGKSAPVNEAVGQPVDPTLSWESASGAASYEYCIDASDDAGCDGSWVSTGADTSAPLAGLAQGTTYFWQVRAQNVSGTTYADAGTWWEFTTVEPTELEATFRSVSADDGWVLEQDEDSGKGGTFDATATTGRLGDDATDRQYRSILDFDTSTLPDDAVITGMTIRIKRQSMTGTNPFTTHGLLTVDLKAGAFHDNPALERLDFHAIGSRGNVGRFIKTPTEGWYRAPLRTPSYALVNLIGHTQFRLRFFTDDNDDGGADFLSFYTGDAPTETDRPELIITYYVP